MPVRRLATLQHSDGCNLGGDAPSRFVAAGSGVINKIPTFSPLITTLQKQNFVTLLIPVTAYKP